MRVVFSADIGGDGSAISDDGDSTTTLLNDFHSSRTIPACQQMANIVQEAKNRNLANSAAGYGLFQENQPYTTGGGGTTCTTYLDRATLNTTVMNSISGASIVSGKLRLANAGTYEIRAKATSYSSASNKPFLQVVVTNTTGGAVTSTLTGNTEWSSAGSYPTSQCQGKFSITQSSDIILRHWLGSITGTNLLGLSHGISASINVYLEIEIIQLY